MDTLKELKKQIAELDKKIEMLEYAEFPFKEGDTYWMVRGDGNISGMTYCNNDYHKKNSYARKCFSHIRRSRKRNLPQRFIIMLQNV